MERLLNKTCSDFDSDIDDAVQNSKQMQNNEKTLREQWRDLEFSIEEAQERMGDADTPESREQVRRELDGLWAEARRLYESTWRSREPADLAGEDHRPLLLPDGENFLGFQLGKRGALDESARNSAQSPLVTFSGPGIWRRRGGPLNAAMNRLDRQLDEFAALDAGNGFESRDVRRTFVEQLNESHARVVDTRRAFEDADDVQLTTGQLAQFQRLAARIRGVNADDPAHNYVFQLNSPNSSEVRRLWQVAVRNVELRAAREAELRTARDAVASVRFNALMRNVALHSNFALNIVRGNAQLDARIDGVAARYAELDTAFAAVLNANFGDAARNAALVAAVDAVRLEDAELVTAVNAAFDGPQPGAFINMMRNCPESVTVAFDLFQRMIAARQNA